MDNNNIKETKKILIFGLIAAIVTVIGEMLGGCAPSGGGVSAGAAEAAAWLEKTAGKEIYAVSAGILLNLFSSFENLTVRNIGLGAAIGGLGISAQYIGYYGLYKTFSDKNSVIARAYFISNMGYTIVGALIHVICSMMTYIYKLNANSADCWSVMGEFSLWFAVPVSIVFFPAYTVLSVTLFIQMFKGNTVFPKWCCLLNPLIGKGLIGGIARALPNSALTNGISYSNMGISSVIIFAVLIACLKRAEGKER